MSPTAPVYEEEGTAAGNKDILTLPEAKSYGATVPIILKTSGDTTVETKR
jgi:hypothetical protein